MEPGTVLGGKYRLVSRLGRGGMGEVWSATDQGLGRRVAIKIVLADLGDDQSLIARLRNEAKTAGGLQHPGITVVHDIGDHDGHPYFVMELLEGTDFNALLAANPAGLSVERVIPLMAQVADALGYAHRKGVVHRDIKPANLMELTEGGAKICDFGISRYAETTSNLTAPGGLLGTPAYMAPEQYDGRPADARSDLYSFGCTLHALLTGRPPFTGPSIAVVIHQHLNTAPPPLTRARPQVPAELEDLVLSLLAKDPADRPVSGAQVGAALRALEIAPLPQAPAPRRPVPPVSPSDHIRDMQSRSSLQLNGEDVPPPSPPPYAPMQQQGPSMAGSPSSGRTGPKKIRLFRAPGRKAPALFGAFALFAGAGAVAVIAVVAVLAVLVAGAGFYGYQKATSGYFLKAEGDNVVLYEGNANGFLGLKRTSKAATKLQPAVKLSDLPSNVAAEVRAQKEQKGNPAAIKKRIESAKCVFTFQVAPVDEFVGIKRLSTNRRCQAPHITMNPADNTRLPQPALEYLPQPDADAVAKGIPFPKIEDAVAKLNELDKTATDCSRTPGTDGCPATQ